MVFVLYFLSVLMWLVAAFLLLGAVTKGDYAVGLVITLPIMLAAFFFSRKAKNNTAKARSTRLRFSEVKTENPVKKHSRPVTENEYGAELNLAKVGKGQPSNPKDNIKNNSIEKLLQNKSDKWVASKVRLPKSDPEEMEVRLAQPQQRRLSGMRFGLVYEDAHGSVSERKVRVVAVTKKNDDHYMQAFCEMRKAVRSFRLDRILEAVDLSTGELIELPQEFFASVVGLVRPEYEQTDQTIDDGLAGKLIDTFGDELRILCPVAHADGHFRKPERELILKYAETRSQEQEMQLNSKSLATLGCWLRTQDSQPEQIMECIRKAAKWQPRLIDSIWVTANAVASADKKWTENEITVVDLIKVELVKQKMELGLV